MADVVFSGLSFFDKSKDGYARVEASFPPLSAVSVCIRVQFPQHHGDLSTLFSYAAPTLTNEFQLRGCLDKNKRQVLLALIIHGKHHSYKAWFPNNGDWHHVCVTWRKSDGLWNIYVDGEKRDSASDKASSRDIYGNGIFILGQDQDSFGGTFTEPYLGNMTDVNIWNLWLTEKQIQTLFTCSDSSDLNPFFSWHKRNLTLHPVVKEISGMVQCPGEYTVHIPKCQWVKVQTLKIEVLACAQSRAPIRYKRCNKIPMESRLFGETGQKLRHNKAFKISRFARAEAERAGFLPNSASL